MMSQLSRQPALALALLSDACGMLAAWLRSRIVRGRIVFSLPFQVLQSILAFSLTLSYFLPPSLSLFPSCYFACRSFSFAAFSTLSFCLYFLFLLSFVHFFLNFLLFLFPFSFFLHSSLYFLNASSFRFPLSLFLPFLLFFILISFLSLFPPSCPSLHSSFYLQFHIFSPFHTMIL
jgi:hypothetical protein